MSVEVLVNEGDLAEMVDQIWVAYLDPEGVNPLIPTDAETKPAEMQASVSITGSWNGHIVLASSIVAARAMAAAFLAVGPDRVTQDDVADVLGELANIFGGNVKAMLPTGAKLSLPHVVPAADTAAGLADAELVTGLYGIWDGEPVSVSIWQRR